MSREPCWVSASEDQDSGQSVFGKDDTLSHTLVYLSKLVNYEVRIL